MTEALIKKDLCLHFGCEKSLVEQPPENLVKIKVLAYEHSSWQDFDTKTVIIERFLGQTTKSGLSLMEVEWEFVVQQEDIFFEEYPALQDRLRFLREAIRHDESVGKDGRGIAVARATVSGYFCSLNCALAFRHSMMMSLDLMAVDAIEFYERAMGLPLS